MKKTETQESQKETNDIYVYDKDSLYHPSEQKNKKIELRKEKEFKTDEEGYSR